MIDERHEEEASLYVLGLLEPAEARAFETKLRADAELQEYVRELENDAAQLALAAPPVTPPAHLEKKILSQIAGKESAESKIIRPWAFLVPWAIAACLAVFCGVQYTEVSKLRDDVAVLQANADLSKVLISELRSTAEKPEAIRAVVVWNNQQKEGILKLVDQLPAPPEGKDYQLWVLDPEQTQPVSAGIVSVDRNGLTKVSLPFRPANPVKRAEKFAISVEQKGGVPQVQGPIVLMSGAQKKDSL